MLLYQNSSRTSWPSGYNMRFTVHVQNLEEVDIVFPRAITHK